MLENFKKFPLVARVIFGLQLLACVSSMFGAINILRIADDQISMIYMLAGGDAPSKFNLYMTILSTLLVISSILFVFFNPNKQSLMIYFGVIIFNLIMGVFLNGLNIYIVLTSLIFPLTMAYILNENRYLFQS